MPRQIGNETYLTLPEAAKEIGVSHMTLYRWVRDRDKMKRANIKALIDPMSNHYYIAEESVERLANRFQPVKAV